MGLEKENIHISDKRGSDLAALLKAKTRELSHYQKTRLKETELRNKIVQALALRFGKENVDVQADVVLDFNRADVSRRIPKVLDHQIPNCPLTAAAKYPVKKMEVSVVINQAVLEDRILTEKKRQEVIGVVTRAIGSDTVARLDKISVQSFIFNRIKCDWGRNRDADHKNLAERHPYVTMLSFLSAVFFVIFGVHSRVQIQRQRNDLEM